MKIGATYFVNYSFDYYLFDPNLKFYCVLKLFKTFYLLENIYHSNNK